MAKIVWEGNRKEFGASRQSPPVPQDAIKIRDGEGLLKRAIPFGIFPLVICFAAIVVKAYVHKQPPVSPLFLPPAIAIGLIVALPLHELTHAVCYPKGAEVRVGLCLRKLAAYAISYEPLTKSRFIIMSLAPAVWGLIPLIGFLLIPITMKPLLTICMVSAFMGLISPAPDYMDIVSVLKKAPPHALIRDSQDGLYAYLSKE